MNKKLSFPKSYKDLLFYAMLILLAAWNLWSLSYSPIAWYDEVIFASGTHSLLTGQGLTLGIDGGTDMFFYGPVYFLLTAASGAIGGFNIFTFRIVNLLFAFLSAYMVFRIMRELGIRRQTSRIVILLFLTDTLFVQNSHSGRMEFVALFFALAAYYIYFRNSTDWRSVSLLALASAFAFMTTPRVLVILLPMLIGFLVRLVKRKRWIMLLPYVLLPVAAYAVWIYASYGSVGLMLDSYVHPEENHTASLWTRFIGGNWRVAMWHYPLVAGALLSVGGALYKRKFSVDMLMLVLPILVFYLVVFDTGLYAALILPFYYILLGRGLDDVKGCGKLFRGVYYAVVALCAVVNAGIFTVKAVNVIVTKDCRNGKTVAEWVKDNIPPGSRVAGSYAYYYACVDNGCDFRRVVRDYVPSAVTYEDLINDFRPEYVVMWTSENIPAAKECFNMFDMVEISHFDPCVKENRLLQILNRYGFEVSASYAGDLYKVNY